MTPTKATTPVGVRADVARDNTETETPVTTFQAIVGRIQAAHPDRQVPGFDSVNGNENASILFVLEAPGRKAVESGVISTGNNDQTARYFRDQLAAAGITPNQIAIWNVVPWYIGDGAKIRSANKPDIDEGVVWLQKIIAAMPQFRMAVLVGERALKAAPALSRAAA
jgi:uracil-DNA glycosylase